MKKKKSAVLALSLAVGLLCQGCGTPMYELTEEEERVIVSSAAYFLAKHNVFQKDGCRAIPKESLKNQQKPKPEQSEQSEQEETQNNTQNGSGTAENNAQSGETVTMAELLGHKDKLKISYQGYSIKESIKQDDYYIVGAETGKVYLVMRFNLANEGAEKIEIDNIHKGPVFLCQYKGSDNIIAESTFLENDLAMYKGTIEAGASEDVILLFEIPEKDADTISGIQLKVSDSGTEKGIEI